ncbi:MAG: phosphoenolpyruvate--protein phosphotransferase [Verrucomicrobiota bacterium]
MPGIGRGRIIRIGGLRVPHTIALNGATDFAAEVRKVDTALAALVNDYEDRLPRHESRLEIQLLKAHRSIARDPEFRAKLHGFLRNNQRTAAGAIVDVENHFTALLAKADSVLLRERALDVQDVCFQLLRQIHGKSAVIAEVQLTADSIIVAETLTPGQFLALNRNFLKGLVLGHAGSTSHTVILARSFGIPTLTGVTDLAFDCSPSDEAIVDAECGLLLTALTEATRRYYAMEDRRLAERQIRLRHYANRPAHTPDGHHVEIGGNIGTAAEAIAAFAAGAEGIGLFRTEMLFFDRDTPPTEEEQYVEYCKALQAAGERPVITRTLDIGGDKPLAYLHLPAEDNPFLGYRAVRIYPEYETLFRSQIRALVRASAHGTLKVLIPMVTTPEEILWAKYVIREEQNRCRTAGLAFDPDMAIGAMIEVPAAAFQLDALCRELDFFSIGSNDLLQYFAGADRANPRLAKLYDPLQPAFLRLLKKVVSEARAEGKWIGLCGEMGGHSEYLPILMGLGLDEISAAPSLVTALKAEVALWPLNVCRELVERALACVTPGEVRRLLDEFAARRPAPLVDPELVIIESTSTTKEEVIKEAVDRLYVLGRTQQPRALEQALWQRESVYSTGFGHGFAIPHCKTSTVTANSLVLMRLRTPVAWGSLDGEPVQTVLLLTIRESDQANGHMNVFSKLARKVMHEDFREHLSRAPDPAVACALLTGVLGA